MRELENFTLKEVTEYIIEEIAIDKEISKKLAKKLFVNALTYNIVVNEIREMIDSLLEN